ERRSVLVVRLSGLVGGLFEPVLRLGEAIDRWPGTRRGRSDLTDALGRVLAAGADTLKGPGHTVLRLLKLFGRVALVLGGLDPALGGQGAEGGELLQLSSRVGVGPGGRVQGVDVVGGSRLSITPGSGIPGDRVLKALDTARSVDVGTVGSDQALVVCVGAGGKSVECGLGGYDGQGDPCDPPCRRHRDGSADGRRGGSDGRRKSSLGSSGGRGGSGIGDGRRSAGGHSGDNSTLSRAKRQDSASHRGDGDPQCAQSSGSCEHKGGEPDQWSGTDRV